MNGIWIVEDDLGISRTSVQCLQRRFDFETLDGKVTVIEILRARQYAYEVNPKVLGADA